MPDRPLKVDLHTHCKGDPQDAIPHTPEELIDEAARQGFDAIAITNHDCDLYCPHLAGYAASMGVLLIPGSELTYQGQHIVLVNFSEFSELQTPDDILSRKRPENLVIAAHPYYPFAASCGPLLEDRPEIFDAVEYAHLYVPGVNFNRPAVRRARELGLPVVGTSDAHRLWVLGRTYTLVHARKEPGAIARAIKEGRCELVSEPLGYVEFFDMIAGMGYDSLGRRVKRLGRFVRDMF